MTALAPIIAILFTTLTACSAPVLVTADDDPPDTAVPDTAPEPGPDTAPPAPDSRPALRPDTAPAAPDALPETPDVAPETAPAPPDAACLRVCLGAGRVALGGTCAGNPDCCSAACADSRCVPPDGCHPPACGWTECP